MNQKFYDAVSMNPVIAAVKNESGLYKCIENTDIAVVFVLYGSVATICTLVEQLKQADKTVIVHMDLVTGLSARPEAVDFIAQYTKADGVISTRIEQIRRAKELSLYTVYRIFAIDSKVLDNVAGNRAICEYADFVEILPGLMPKVIRMMCRHLTVPVITGGLISEKEHVIAALNAGAAAISATNQVVWGM